MPSNPPRLLDQVREALRRKHYALRTEEAYVGWIRRFILFHGKQHPRHLGHAEVQAFLTDLAVTQHVAASTQNQALSALRFLYNEVLQQPLEGPIDSVRAKQPTRLPTVLTRDEAGLTGPTWSINSRSAGLTRTGRRRIVVVIAFLPGTATAWLL